MPGPIVSSLRLAAGAYIARLATGHLAAYPLAALGGYAVEQFDRAGLHASRSAVPFGAWLLGAFAALGVFVGSNVLAHRWALAAASLRATADGPWVAHVVTLMLQRASGDDRRGVRAARRVMDLLGGDRPGSRAARFALARVGGGAVGQIATALAHVPPGDAPIGQRVQQRVVSELDAQRRGRAWFLAGWAAAVVAAALAATRV